MELARIFGRPYIERITVPGIYLRSSTTDLEVLLDALDYGLSIWDPEGVIRSAGAQTVDEFRTSKGIVSRDELSELGASDRNSLQLRRDFKVDAEPWATRAIIIDCQSAYVEMMGAAQDSDRAAVAEYILRDSTARPTWPRLRYLLPWAVLLPLIIGYVGTILTQPFTPFAHILLAGVLVLAIVGTTKWSKTLKQGYEWITGTIRVRTKSRKETYADRANNHANIRVGLWTAIVVAPVSIAATLITTWLTSSN